MERAKESRYLIGFKVNVGFDRKGESSSYQSFMEVDHVK